MKPFRSFVPPLAVMLMAASGGASAQGVLIDKSEIRFVAKQMGASLEGRFRKWKANVDFRPMELAKSKASFEIELASIDLASEESETETRRPSGSTPRSIRSQVHVDRDTRSRRRPLRDRRRAVAQGPDQGHRGSRRAAKDAAGNSVAEGQFTLKRLEYKIGEGPWADTDAIADDVVVRVRMVLPPIAS